jgi:cytoskeletal protein CcmA (bactofilin family)
MAMFSSTESSGPAPARSGGRENLLSIIAPGMRVVGELHTDGVVKIEGVVEGSIRAKQQVLVAKEGTVEGDIHTKEAVVGGKVIGAIFADQRVEVQTSSVIEGDITTQRIVVHEGGEVNGHVRMANPRTAEKPPVRKPADVPTAFGAPPSATPATSSERATPGHAS